MESRPPRRRGISACFVCASACATLLTAACGGRPSPAVGTWSGAAGPARAQLTLAEGGTGTLRLPPLIAEVPVTWEEDAVERRLTIRVDGERVGASPGAAPREGQLPLTATVSEDEDVLTVKGFPVLSDLRLTRSAPAE